MACQDVIESQSVTASSTAIRDSRPTAFVTAKVVKSSAATDILDVFNKKQLRFTLPLLYVPSSCNVMQF
jgi:hypothetical protein